VLVSSVSVHSEVSEWIYGTKYKNFLVVAPFKMYYATKS